MSTCGSQMKNYVADFGKETTLHGFRYIIDRKLHLAERLLWLTIVILAVYAAGSLILNSWTRYDDNPTVISLEKDFRDWNLDFPAATVCFKDKLNKSLAEEFIMERWGIDTNSSDYDAYQKFIQSIVNLSYETMGDFNLYENTREFTSVKGEEMAAIARKIMVQMEFHATIFNTAFDNLAFVETLTEMGICFTYAGIVSNYISLVQNPTPNRSALPTCNYLNSLCYSRIEDLPVPIRYYIHSRTEIPDCSEKYFTVDINMERDTSFRFQQTVASKDLIRLDPRQRQCRYFDEPVNKGEFVYSYNFCRMKCRMNLAFKYCGCAPYFYQKKEGIPVCDVNGLACLSKYTNNIIRLRDEKGEPIKCGCSVQCEATDFYIDKENERKWTYPVPCNIRFRWAVEHYSKTRHKRDIIYGFEDLLVSLGGTAALFLGCSVLSFVEVGYYFTLRLFWFIVKKKKEFLPKH